MSTLFFNTIEIHATKFGPGSGEISIPSVPHGTLIRTAAGPAERNKDAALPESLSPVSL